MNFFLYVSTCYWEMRKNSPRARTLKIIPEAETRLETLFHYIFFKNTKRQHMIKEIDNIDVKSRNLVKKLPVPFLSISLNIFEKLI